MRDGAHRFRPRGAVGNTRGRVFSPGKGWLRVAGRVFSGWVHDGFEVINVILRGFSAGFSLGMTNDEC